MLAVMDLPIQPLVDLPPAYDVYSGGIAKRRAAVDDAFGLPIILA